ncbi:family 20 glycosylhydrolase [Apilactobacillus apisilvae]|uniref:beta-N-acetylhexosaminidase n=1 Tax=Apilactobacillus apisilvae TaxID=2923364 RepID=A0ABY4PIN7_9LACO|nr:family 20 glycosylhydrolase [Apilactobacillus apisilvae]UQS85378.1 family 20 glycosylhydrolase [Apilactobacillus apisilvae]
MKLNKKLIVSFILISILILGCLIYGWHLINVNADRKRIGMSIDCARNFQRPSIIKKYINEINSKKGNYLTLHLTDNENFALESKTLGQTIQNAKVKDGVYYNPQTNLPFLSKTQLSSLIQYGSSKGVEVIPEIDVPGHAQAIFKLLQLDGQNDLYQKVFNPNGYNEMIYSKQATIDFSKNLIDEYLPLISKNGYLSIGGDEITVANQQQESNVVKYINSMDDYLNNHQVNMIMWNDAFHKRVINQYHKNILINYWSLNGQKANQQQSQQNIKLRATMPELNKAGFKTINCNFYYLYLITDSRIFNQNNIEYWQNSLKKWNQSIWNDNDSSNLDKSNNNIGAQLSIWGDDSTNISDKDLYQKLQPYIKTYFDDVK